MNTTMKLTLALALTGLLCLPLAAQFSGGIRDQARQSQAKVDKMTKKIDALDAEIEAEIAEVVALLSSVRDSTGTSRTGTSRGNPIRPMLIDAKQQAILGLLETIQENQRQLLALEGQVGKVWGTIPDDAVLQQIDTLEKKIETRIDQIVAIATSLTRHEDLERSSMVKRSGSGSTRFRKRTTNPDYILNQRVSRVSEPIRRRVAEELAASGDRLQRKIVKTQSNLAQVEDASRREAMEADLVKLQEQLAKREKQFDAVASDDQPETKIASLAEAETIKRQAHDKVAHIREKHDTLVSLVSDRNLEMNRLRGLQTRLQFMGGY